MFSSKDNQEKTPSNLPEVTYLRTLISIESDPAIDGNLASCEIISSASAKVT